MEEAIDGLNRVVEGVDGIKTALHVCRGNRERSLYARGDYEPVLPFLMEARVDQLAMEFAASEAGDIGVFEGHSWDKEIGLGVVDVRSPEVDSEEVIIERVDRALKHFTPEQITLTPDCGFAPSSTNPIPLNEAYLKLETLSQAAQTLRKRYA